MCVLALHARYAHGIIEALRGDLLLLLLYAKWVQLRLKELQPGKLRYASVHSVLGLPQLACAKVLMLFHGCEALVNTFFPVRFEAKRPRQAVN